MRARSGGHAANLMGNWLDLVDDKPFSLYQRCNESRGWQAGLSQALGSVLEMLTKGGRHQQLLDAALGFVAEKLRDPALEKARAACGELVKTEHKWKQMLLPTEWIDQAADAKSSGLC